jgi:hypothetical protein
VSWKLSADVDQKVRKVGTDASEQLISTTFEQDEAKDGTVMPNMETLREMAERFTRQVRNRLVANTGEIRAAQPGIEIAQGEDLPKCNDYAKALQNNPDRFRIEQKIDPQAPLDTRTRGAQTEERVALCEKVRDMSIYAVNPQSTGGGQANPTSPDGAWVDEWRTRASLLTIDQAGANPNEVDMPRNARIEKNEMEQGIAVYEEGGRNMKTVAMTNLEQMESYNQALEDAKAGYRAISARTDRVPDRDSEIDQWKLKKGEINLVKLNGMTPDQRLQVKGSFPRDQVTGAADDPGENLETTPNQIIVRQR